MDDPLKKLKAFFSPKQAPLDERVNAAYDNKTFGKGRPTKENKAAQQGIPAWLDSLYKSPVADSLYQTSGVPSHLGIVNRELYPRTSGVFNANFDSVQLDSLRDTHPQDPRSTLIHEMGHKYATENRVLDKAGPAYQYPYSDPMNAVYATKPADKAAAKIDTYGATDSKEGYAQAFKNAFNFLSETALNPDMDYRQFAGDLEGSTPGMGMIVQDLMKRPIFAKHPLQGKIFREKK
jgi:hypothetical protein